MGCWLLVMQPTNTMRFTAITVFVVLAAVSLFNIASGKVNCGCFGSAINTSPHWMLILNIACIVSLLALWPKHHDSAIKSTTTNGYQNKSNKANHLQPTTASIGIAVLIGIAGVVCGNSISRTFSNTAYIAPSSVNFGKVYSGNAKNHLIEVTNPSKQAIKIVGGRSRGPFYLDAELPAVIEPGATVQLSVNLKPPAALKYHSEFQREITLWTDSERQPTIQQTLFAWIGPAKTQQLSNNHLNCFSNGDLK